MKKAQALSNDELGNASGGKAVRTAHEYYDENGEKKVHHYSYEFFKDDGSRKRLGIVATVNSDDFSQDQIDAMAKVFGTSGTVVGDKTFSLRKPS